MRCLHEGAAGEPSGLGANAAHGMVLRGWRAPQVQLAAHQRAAHGGEEACEWQLQPLGEFLFKGKGHQPVWKVLDAAAHEAALNVRLRPPCTLLHAPSVASAAPPLPWARAAPRGGVAACARRRLAACATHGSARSRTFECSGRRLCLDLAPIGRALSLPDMT